MTRTRGSSAGGGLGGEVGVGPGVGYKGGGCVSLILLVVVAVMGLKMVLVHLGW